MPVHTLPDLPYDYAAPAPVSPGIIEPEASRLVIVFSTFARAGG